MFAETLQRVVELMPGPALAIGPGGEVLVGNDQAASWLGAGGRAIAGRALAGMVADPPDQVAGFLEKCTRAGRKVAGELTPIRAGHGAGGACRIEGIAMPIAEQAGGTPAVVIRVVEDGPEAVLREEIRCKDEFLDRLAHDLRNPVAALSAAMHLSRQATSAEDLVWAGESMERQVQQLVRQLDALLDLARITRGRIALHRRRVDGAAVARAAASAARPILEAREVQLTLATTPGDLTIEADPARLEQMLVVLLDHVSGTIEPGGGVRLAVGRDRETVAFRVSNRPENLASPTLVAAWDQSVGPALVRKIAEMHGGTTGAQADENSGGRREVIVRLPAAGPSASAIPTPTSAAGGSRILVVDDNNDAARGTARLLQIAGHDVRIAHDGRQALDLAEEFRPRFFLLDIGLPGMDGYEVARRLRANPTHRDAVIIAISGYSVDEYREPRSAGFDHHLVKPIDYSALRAILAQHASD